MNRMIMTMMIMLLALFPSLALSETSTASITLSFIVPTILRVERLPDGKVHIQANTPNTIIVEGGTLTCPTSLDVLPLDVTCEVAPLDAQITLEAM